MDGGAAINIIPSYGAGTIQLDIAWTFAALNSSQPRGPWWGPLTRLGRGATKGEWDYDAAASKVLLWVVLSPVVGHRLLIAGLDGATMPLTSGQKGSGSLSPGVVPVIAPVPFDWAVP